MDEKKEFIQKQIDTLTVLTDKCSDLKQRLEKKMVEMKKVMKGLPDKRGEEEKGNKERCAKG